MITPLKHQQKVVDFILNERHRGILLFHSVGSGKTITSILAAKALVTKYPKKKVIVLTPTSLVENYNKEINKLGISFEDKLKIYSYGIFVNLLKEEKTNLCFNKILIIDEAHKFGRNGTTSKYIIKCALKAFKVILLTATPVQNTPLEIANLIQMIIGSTSNRFNLNAILDNNLNNEFNTLFECKVSVFNVNDFSRYPTSKTHDIILSMSKEYYNEYYKIEKNIRSGLPDIFINSKNLITFLNGARRAVNTINIVSPKIIWTIEKVNEDLKNNKKILIYSAWKSAGINIIKMYLTRNKIKFSEVSGSISKEVRNKYVIDYNNNITKVMLITQAGAEGLDLKGTRSIIIVDQHWNSAKLEQVVGRGIRYDSHANLPKEQRHVDIYYLYLNKPINILLNLDSVPSADIILKKISDEKNIDIQNFYRKLDKVSIEKNNYCFK